MGLQADKLIHIYFVEPIHKQKVHVLELFLGKLPGLVTVHCSLNFCCCGCHVWYICACTDTKTCRRRQSMEVLDRGYAVVIKK